MTTGEIQSTNRPAVQNSIYGVGSLLLNEGERPILCLANYSNRTTLNRKISPWVARGPKCHWSSVIKVCRQPISYGFTYSTGCEKSGCRTALYGGD